MPSLLIFFVRAALLLSAPASSSKNAEGQIIHVHDNKGTPTNLNFSKNIRRRQTNLADNNPNDTTSTREEIAPKGQRAAQAHQDDHHQPLIPYGGPINDEDLLSQDHAAAAAEAESLQAHITTTQQEATAMKERVEQRQQHTAAGDNQQGSTPQGQPADQQSSEQHEVETSETEEQQQEDDQADNSQQNAALTNPEEPKNNTGDTTSSTAEETHTTSSSALIEEEGQEQQQEQDDDNGPSMPIIISVGALSMTNLLLIVAIVFLYQRVKAFKERQEISEKLHYYYNYPKIPSYSEQDRLPRADGRKDETRPLAAADFNDDSESETITFSKPVRQPTVKINDDGDAVLVFSHESTTKPASSSSLGSSTRSTASGSANKTTDII